MPNTVRLHRVLRATPEKVYRAFVDADALAKWLPPYGFTCKVHQLDARVGGTYRMSFTNFTTEKSHSFGGKYIELSPGQRLRYTDQFDDPNLPGELQTTVTLKKVVVGTKCCAADRLRMRGLPDHSRCPCAGASTPTAPSSADKARHRPQQCGSRKEPHV